MFKVLFIHRMNSAEKLMITLREKAEERFFYQ